MSDIRGLVETFRKASASWGRTLRAIYANDADRIEKDLLAAITRLEAKAATAKAECEAWREQEAAYISLNRTEQVDLDKSRDRVASANKALSTARAATDEAWREQEQEHQS